MTETIQKTMRAAAINRFGGIDPVLKEAMSIRGEEPNPGMR